jgi:hypothetical protein
MAVGNRATENIDHEVGGAAMTGMLNLGDVLELVNDGFDNSGVMVIDSIFFRHRSRTILSGEYLSYSIHPVPQF